MLWSWSDLSPKSSKYIFLGSEILSRFFCCDNPLLLVDIFWWTLWMGLLVNRRFVWRILALICCSILTHAAGVALKSKKKFCFVFPGKTKTKRDISLMGLFPSVLLLGHCWLHWGGRGHQLPTFPSGDCGGTFHSCRPFGLVIFPAHTLPSLFFLSFFFFWPQFTVYTQQIQLPALGVTRDRDHPMM